MFKVMSIFLIVLAVLGLSTFILASLYHSSIRNAERRRRFIIQSLCTFFACSFGYAFLRFGVANPIEVMVAVAMTLCAGYGAAFINPKYFMRP